MSKPKSKTLKACVTGQGQAIPPVYDPCGICPSENQCVYCHNCGMGKVTILEMPKKGAAMSKPKSKTFTAWTNGPWEKMTGIRALCTTRPDFDCIPTPCPDCRPVLVTITEMPKKGKKDATTHVED